MKQFHFTLFPMFLLVVVASVVGCRPRGSPPSDNTLTAGGRNFMAHGIIRQIAMDRHSATIQHDAIAGYMGAMTMDFPMADTNELHGLDPGDEITFQLVVTDTNDWVQDVQLVAHHLSDVTNDEVVFHVPSAELKVGDLLPDGALTTEKGDTVRFSDFRGRAVAFTFFFTSCPLPDFCPKMNRNFAEARQLLFSDGQGSNGTAAAPSTNWEFISISFDPLLDRPAVLAGYANLYRSGDTNRWLFAVAETNTLAALAPALDLQFWRENGSITHNLRTVVLDPTGRIAKQFDGNDWTAQELAEAMRQAAKARTK